MATGSTPVADPPRTPPRARWRVLVTGMRIAATRLRFLAVFAVVFAIIGSWETLRTYSARLFRPAVADSGISTDTEYFCPMDPGVIGDWPSKCPVCNMTLVLRKKGDAAALPDGVLARMQLTPYRLSLGGVATAPVDYLPLARTVTLAGVVRGPTRIEATAFPRECEGLAPGQSAEITRDGDRTGQAWTARVAEVSPPGAAGATTRRVVLDREPAEGVLQLGDHVLVRIPRPVEEMEPFRSQPSQPPPLLKDEPRRLYSCMTHPDVVKAERGRCPKDQTDLMRQTLQANQRVRWWCPMHPEVTADRAGKQCDACGGMILVPRLISYRLPGTVLAVPASAVIDDGVQALVYVVSGPGMFDARAVALGPRCGGSYPVVSGLQPGDRVVAQGTFLVDAETRLNSSLAASYFGAGDRGGASQPTADASLAWLEELPAADRPLALQQKICPVTDKPLGSMGTPGKVQVEGATVFVCCEGCGPAIEANPKKYLAKLPRAGATP